MMAPNLLAIFCIITGSLICEEEAKVSHHFWSDAVAMPASCSNTPIEPEQLMKMKPITLLLLLRTYVTAGYIRMHTWLKT